MKKYYELCDSENSGPSSRWRTSSNFLHFPSYFGGELGTHKATWSRQMYLLIGEESPYTGRDRKGRGKSHLICRKGKKAHI